MAEVAPCETREFGVSHLDVYRVLPRVVSGAAVSRIEDGLRIVFADGRLLWVHLQPEQERRLGELRMAYTELRFRFEGFSAGQRREFMALFERSFQKGGG